MSLTQPALNAVAFAVNSAYKNVIPLTTTTLGLASFDNGFPYENMIKKIAGGVSPSGKDFNGIFNQLSQHQVWINAGGKYKFNGELANAIGGYAKGSVLLLDNGLSTVISTIDNNINNPNSAMTGWASHGGDLKFNKSGGTITGDVTIEGELTLGTSSLASKNGHTYLPNGYIYQFGYIALSDMIVISQTSPDERYAIIDLPIPFPTEAINPNAVVKATNTGFLSDLFAQVVNPTTTQITVKTCTIQGNNNADGIDGVYWSVIGH